MKNTTRLLTVLITGMALFGFGCSQKMDSMDMEENMTTEKTMEMMDEKKVDTNAGGDSMEMMNDKMLDTDAGSSSMKETMK